MKVSRIDLEGSGSPQTAGGPDSSAINFQRVNFRSKCTVPPNSNLQFFVLQEHGV
eukprot:m.221763 g.221763  ORF g.221763 m.221763 type:complete len:55 (-) comp15881_c0_seq1:1870-2034(-)